MQVHYSMTWTFCTQDNPGEDKALVVVKYQNLEGGSVSTQIYLSPRIEKWDEIQNWFVPAYCSERCEFISWNYIQYINFVMYTLYAIIGLIIFNLGIK